MKKDIAALVQNNRDFVVALRRYFHTYPELSALEFNTQKKIMAELSAMGLHPRMAAGTGVIAELQGSRSGKTIAIRADIDALPLQDECEQPYRSQNQGVCHACGHDGHAAMLLGVAKVLTEMKEDLAGNVRFLFQPTEEQFPGGALPLIQEGALAGVDAIIGGHLWQPLPVGTVGIAYGRMMAAPDEFSITVKGRGGHGSMPHQTINALLVAAQLAISLSAITSQNVDPLEPAVLSLGAIKAGEVFNIIPDTAVLKGTVRSFEPKVRRIIFDKIEQISQGICAAAGATCTIDTVFGFPPVINAPEVTRVFAEAGAEVLGTEGVIEIKPVMTGEDFSCFQEKIPGAFMFIGVGNPEKGIIYPQHHPKYDIDETALANGVEIMVRTILKLVS
jgi:amidohydrolase